MASKRPPKRVYHCDDRVVIVEPAIYVRTGYPLGFANTRTAMETTYGRQIIDALFSLEHPTCAMGWPTHLVDVWRGLYGEMLNQMARADLRHHHFGGRERAVHTRLDERFRGREGRVTGKRVVKTGTYHPGSGPDYWDGECRPPELRNVRSHVILELDVWLDDPTSMFACPERVEIEECHVKPRVTQEPGGVSLVHI